jgi:hypothetical protein
MRDDEMLTREAACCDDCLPWLEHCHAECCSHFGFHLRPESDVTCDPHEVRLRLRLSRDAKRYYKLHGARVDGDVLVLPAQSCEFLSDRIWVTMRCSALQEGLLCGLHPDRKPQLCTDLTLDTARDPAYRLTPRCLFRYKLRAASRDSISSAQIGAEQAHPADSAHEG